MPPTKRINLHAYAMQATRWAAQSSFQCVQEIEVGLEHEGVEHEEKEAQRNACSVEQPSASDRALVIDIGRTTNQVRGAPETLECRVD